MWHRGKYTGERKDIIFRWETALTIHSGIGSQVTHKLWFWACIWACPGLRVGLRVGPLPRSHPSLSAWPSQFLLFWADLVCIMQMVSILDRPLVCGRLWSNLRTCPTHCMQGRLISSHTHTLQVFLWSSLFQIFLDQIIFSWGINCGRHCSRSCLKAAD